MCHRPCILTPLHQTLVCSRVFAEQAEIKAYLQQTAHDYGVIPHIHMQQEMTDSAWDEQAKLWRITTDKQQYL